MRDIGKTKGETTEFNCPARKLRTGLFYLKLKERCFLCLTKHRPEFTTHAP